MPIHIFEEKAFCGLSSLTIITLKHCEIREMPPLNPVKHTLKAMRLLQNQITSIPHGYFFGFPKLHTLDMSSNFLRSVSQIYSLSATVRYLIFGSNRLEDFPAIDHNVTYTVLSALYLSNNKLTEFKENMLKRFPRLHYITLMMNPITRVDDLRGICRLVRLTVSDLPDGTNIHTNTNTKP